MELPQPRPLGSEGRKQTHDFLSLYAPVQQDPNVPSPSQANSLQTHNFLQPLRSTKEGTTSAERFWEKPAIPSPPPSTGEHFLPGGIGTYSINHISLCNKVPKVEGSTVFTMSQDNVNSKGIPYMGNGCTLWERSAMKRGKKGKKNIAGDILVTPEAGIVLGEGEWMTSERPSQSSSNNSSSHHLTSTTYSSFSSSQPLSSKKNQSFMDMLKSVHVGHEEELEDEAELIIKEEPSSHPRNDVVDAKRDDKKPNTPRSKHSATEQRRRSKINDRFQRLRELIPRSDQKRDKASFLLEVIEYIHHLRDKVQKYEEQYQGWNQEPPKLEPWVKRHKPASSIGKNVEIEEPKTLLHPVENESMMMATMNIPQNPTYPTLLTQLWSMKANGQQQHNVETGTLNISTTYSHRLLNNLTQALQTSGVELSQTTISVKLDIRKQPNLENGNRSGSPAKLKGNEPVLSNQALKRLKTK